MRITDAGPQYEWFTTNTVWLIGVFLGLACLESAVRAVKRQPVSKVEVLVNLGMWLFELVLRTFSGGFRWWVFSAVSTWAFASLSLRPWSYLLLFLAVDCLYYWRHRLLHSTRLGWALHAPHHSSTDLSLTSSLRLGWVQRVVDDFFYLPLVLLGVPPLAVFVAIELNHASQFWCHTLLIGRIPWLDFVLNTPSNHRVHHARDRRLADSNYAATFILWDRAFGTYRKEPEALDLGWSTPYSGKNPLVIQFRAIGQWWAARAERSR